VIAPLACVIPAYDAAATLSLVIRQVRKAAPHALVIVVDDGSTDGTTESALSADVVVTMPTNRGKGAALRAGLAVALSHDVSAVVTIDADGQHDAGRIPELVLGLGDADLAIGTRRRGGTTMPLRRRLTNSLSSGAATLLTGVRLEDTQSGFRAIRRAVLLEVTGRGDGYEYETDFLIRASRRGFRIAHVPVPTLYGAPSHFRPVRDTFRIVRTIWRHRSKARP
jgi:glycosyltransferase involved in cell wall biosynthesis